MLINEVCKTCDLTKKAVEYYCEQGLVRPDVGENGYRVFSQSDVERLKKTAVLRKLGLSVADISRVLTTQSALVGISGEKELELSERKERQALMQKLAGDGDWQSARASLDALEKRQSILKRLTSAFPGYYGNYISIHFAPYLEEPIATHEQNEAYEQIIAFWDQYAPEIPEDLRAYIDEVTKGWDGTMVEKANQNMAKAIENTQSFIDENKEAMEIMMEYKKSDEYRQSPAYRFEKLIKDFQQRSGYAEVFIPAMRRLSKSYDLYYTSMLQANEIFLQNYGERS